MAIRTGWSFFLSGLLGIGLASAALEDPKVAFEKLERELETVLEKSEGANAPPDAEASGEEKARILRRMDAAVEAAGDGSEAAKMAVRVFLWSARLEIDLERLPPRFDRIVDRHADHESIVEAVDAAPDLFRITSTPTAWAEATKRLAERTTNKSVKAAAWLATGLLRLKSGEAEKAKSAFRAVIELDADADRTRQAKGYLFEAERLQVGMIAPDFRVKALDGTEVSLGSLRGKVVLLDFWATWCGPCLAETPHLKAAAERFADKPFVIVGVSLDDAREMLEAFVEQKKLPGIQTWDEKGRDNPTGELYNVQELPQWYVIDAEGVIRWRNPFGAALIPAVERVLNGKGTTAPTQQP